jgi:hypothetical protein
MATLQVLLVDAVPGTMLRRADGKEWPEKRVVKLNTNGHLTLHPKYEYALQVTKEDVLAKDWYIVETKTLDELENGDLVLHGENVYLHFDGKFWHSSSEFSGPFTVITSEGYKA